MAVRVPILGRRDSDPTPKRKAGSVGSFSQEACEHEISVLVENLTDAEIRLRARHVEIGRPQVSLPTTIQRAAKLRWRAPNESIAVAAEYELVGGGDCSGRVLVLAASLPSDKDWVPNPLTWISGGSSSSGRFFAELRKPPRAGEYSDLSAALASASHLSGQVSSPGLEWLPVRATADALDIRIRILPPQLQQRRETLEPQPPLRQVNTGSILGESFLGEAHAPDEGKIRRVEGYRQMVEALNKQAAQMEEQADKEPMNLARLRDLPEKVRVDLLLLILGTLLRRRLQALAGWAQETQPQVARSDSSEGRSLFRVLSTVTENVAAMPARIAGDTRVKDEDTRLIWQVLTEHAEHVHKALGPLLGFDQGDKREKVARLVDTYTRCEPGCEPDLPDLASLSVALRSALEEAGSPTSADTTSGSPSSAVVTTLPRFSPELCWPLSSEHTAARFLRRAVMLDPDLAPSTEVAAEWLNLESRTCPGDCCLAYLPHCGAYGVLYRTGREGEALAQLGVADEGALEDGPPGPPVQSVDDFLSGPPAGAAADQAWPPIPRLWLAARELLAMLLGAGDGAFDARSRAAFFELFARLGVPPRLVVRWEAEVGGALFEALETSNIVAQQNQNQKTWNRGKVALAAAGGGILLAVTGGLAAPAVAAGVSAIGTTAVSAGAALGLAQAGAVLGGAIAAWGAALASLGTAGAAVLFGATGAGITGWKLSKRWADLEEFNFQPLARSKRSVYLSVDISDSATTQRLDMMLKSGGGKLYEDVVVQNAQGATVALPKGSALVRGGVIPGAAVAQECVHRQRHSIGALVRGPEPTPTTRYEFQREVDKTQRAVHLAIFVSGWLQDDQDFVRPWADAARLYFPSSGHLTLRWESKQLKELSAIFGKLVAQEVASSTASFWLKSSAAAGVAAGSVAAMTVAWPVWIISAMANLDNSWLVCIERARVAGRCLAHALADRQTVGQRPVTLVGHSIGARLLVYCLLELYSMGEFNVVDDVILLGTPVSTKEAKWQKVRAVASGRVVNGYLGSDWVLAFLYRYMEWGLSVAGLSAVHTPGIENVNLSGLGIAGHHDYPRHVPNILARMRIGERGAVAA